MCEIGCYDMRLYCDGKRDVSEVGWAESCELSDLPESHEFAGGSRAECVRQARKRGWVFKRDGRTLCPKCSRKKRGPRA